MIPGSTTSRRLTAVGALGLLSLLLIGVPVALWAIAGSPLPSSVPSVTDIVDGLTHGPIADSTIIQIVALIGWIAWIQVALSIAVETAAWARGLTAPRLTLAGPIQPAVVKLIATAALLLSSVNVKTAPLGAMPNPSSPVSLVESTVASTTEPPLAAIPTANGRKHVSSRPTAAKTHVVERRDTLWGLAETHLGDPFRWRDLYELNRCKPQSDGRALEDPNLIVVGWRLAFPDDAVGLEPVPVESRRLPPPPGTEVDNTTAKTAPPPSRPSIAKPPTVGSHEPAEPTTPTRPVRQDEPAPQSPSTDPALQPPIDDVGDETSRRLAPLVGGGLLAAALVVLLDRLRRVGIRQRTITSHGPADEKLQATEINLRHAANLDGATRLDLALRALGTGLNRRGGDDIAILAVRLDGDGLEVLLDKPAVAPPAGFESTGDPRGWRLAAGLSEDDLRVLANGAVAPLPSLVTIGTAEGDPILVDIETAGLLTVSGPKTVTLPYLRRLSIELATSTWTDHLDLVTVGEPLGDLVGGKRSRHFAALNDAIKHVQGIAHASDQELAEIGHETTLRARLTGDHGDGWIPTLLICSEEVSSELLDELAEWIQPGRGVGLVLPGPRPEKGWHARLTEVDVHLAPHNLVLEPVALEAETAEEIQQILAGTVAESPAEPEEELEADGHINGTHSATAAYSAPFQEPDPDLEFRVLGDVDVVGAPPIERRKSMEIAVYLALHPDGVTDDRLKTVFWPDATPAQSTFNTTVSMTRSSLGTAVDGDLYLPHYASSGKRYRLSERVTTDLARFEARAAFAKNTSAVRAREALADAMSMVRGQPFDVARGYEWSFAEGFVTRAALAIAEAAHQLAQLALDTGDHAQAEWAATQGLLASPGDESLYRDRMVAAHHAGNTAAIRQIMSELCEIVEANEPYDQLHPETVTLFRSLLGGETPAP